MDIKGIPEARALTYEEYEELIEDGLDPAFQDKENRMSVAVWVRKLVPWMMSKIYPDFDYKKIPWPVARKLALDTYVLTVKGEEESKN